MRMEFNDLEAVYELLAQSIDQAGEDKAALFLAKVTLLLARELGDPEATSAAIKSALQDL